LLVDYFYNKEILSQKLGRERKADPKNELFRYPKSISGDDYDIMDFCSKINKEDIEELIRKIDAIFYNLNDIGYLIAETKAQRKNPNATFGERA
jgi:hypothetical protein